MNVVQLLHQLLVIVDIEVVVTFLPEMGGFSPTQANIGLAWATASTLDEAS